MAAEEHANSEQKYTSNFVEIKTEPIEYHVDIKVEPPDEDSCDDKYSPAKVENVDVSHVKLEKDAASYNVENITVKIEPTYYSSDDDVCLASYQSSQAVEISDVVPRNSLRPILRIPQLKKPRKGHKDDLDEEYVPKRKKKKVPVEIIKKTYQTKAKKAENSYSENVTKHIHLVTITEEERQIEFQDLWQSRQHMRYTCRDCAVGFVMEEPYLVHMRVHTSAAGDHECEICRCRLRSADQLYKHRLRHYRRYRCAICKRIHKDKETAASHVMSEHVREAFTCDQCGKGFKRPAYLKKHVTQQHTKGEKHECPVCARVFFDRSMYRTHYRRHNEEVRNPVSRLFICDECCRQFKNKQALKRHLLVHARERPVPCAHCPATFQTRRGLRLHELSKHTEKDPSSRSMQQCPHCSRECTTPALLRQHIRRMHTDRTKKYQCEHCQRFYYTKGEVRAHIVWSHLGSRGERALFCCGREFRTRTRLKDHIAVHHLKVEKQRIHKCDLCDKAFANKQVLNRHRKSHSDCTYPCPVCGLRFKCSAYVKVHHQLKHLHMTRAEIKAQKQARQPVNQPEDLSMKNVKTNVKHHQLKHMMRAEIKAQKQSRQPANQPEDLSMKTMKNGKSDVKFEDCSVNLCDVKEICFEKVIVKQEVDSDCEVSVPLFDFEVLKRNSGL